VNETADFGNKNVETQKNKESENKFWMSGLASFHGVRAPKICPNCSKPASCQTSILTHSFKYSETEYFLLIGALGVLIYDFARFILFGSGTIILLNVYVCQDCMRYWKKLRWLQWISRIVAIILAIILVKKYFFFNTAPSEGDSVLNLCKILFVAVVLPLMFGSIFAIILRNYAEKNKGVVFCGSKHRRKWFRVKSAEWIDLFLSLNAGTVSTEKREINDSESHEKLCPKCGFMHNWNKSVCRHCSYPSDAYAKIEKKLNRVTSICPKCGQPYQWNSTFCSTCDKQDKPISKKEESKRQMIAMAIFGIIAILLFLFLYSIIT